MEYFWFRVGTILVGTFGGLSYWYVEILIFDFVLGYWGFSPIAHVHSWELDISDVSALVISEHELFRLIAAEFVDSVDHGIGHWDDIPRPMDNLFPGAKAHELVAALSVATWSQADGAFGAWQLTITRCVLFVDLAILPNLQAEMLFEI